MTLFGEDSGAASVTLLAMSPHANGLFYGAIALSGNALCDQYMQSNPHEAAVELANRLECSSEKGEDIVNCLSRQTQQDIIKAGNSMFQFFSFPRWFAPNVDGDVIPDTPENLLIQGKFAKVMHSKKLQEYVQFEFSRTFPPSLQSAEEFKLKLAKCQKVREISNNSNFLFNIKSGSFCRRSN